MKSPHARREPHGGSSKREGSTKQEWRRQTELVGEKQRNLWASAFIGGSGDVQKQV